jgi:hypothetical protein
VDEHGRRGDPVEFSFVSGFPPLRPTVGFEDGETAWLNPDFDFAENEIEFDRISDQRWWDEQSSEWSTGFIEGAPLFSGTLFAIPFRLRSEVDPRVSDVSDEPPSDAPEGSVGYSDHVRSFAYELTHPSDPDNSIANGAGDRMDRYLSVDSYGSLDLEGDRTWTLFVPDLFFTNPEYFEPGEECGSAPFCEIGNWLLDQIGSLHLKVRSRTVDSGSSFYQLSPMPARNLIIDLADYGRFSPELDMHFSVQLVLTDDQGNLTGVWPPGPAVPRR